MSLLPRHKGRQHVPAAAINAAIAKQRPWVASYLTRVMDQLRSEAPRTMRELAFGHAVASMVRECTRMQEALTAQELGEHVRRAKELGATFDEFYDLMRLDRPARVVPLGAARLLPWVGVRLRQAHRLREEIVAGLDLLGWADLLVEG